MSISARIESRVACWTSAAETSTPAACARALTLSPSALSVSRQSPSSAEVSSLPARVRHDVGALVLQALEELLPLGIDRGGVGLVAGIEVLEVVGIAAVKERGAGEGGIGVLTRHAQVL